jgi:hypothetical protein
MEWDKSRTEGSMPAWKMPREVSKDGGADPAALTPQERNETFQKGPADWGQEQGSQQQGSQGHRETDWQQPEVNRPPKDPDKQEPAAEKVTPPEVVDEL